jgi:competence protein ComEC
MKIPSLPSFSFAQSLSLSPLGVIAGVMIAYNFPQLPATSWLMGGAVVILLILAIRTPRQTPLIIILVMTLLGIMRWQHTMVSHHPPTLSKHYRFAPITGIIAHSEAMQRGQYRLTLTHVNSPVFLKGDKDITARLSVRTNTSPPLGNIIRMRATLFPPSRPAIEGGADFTRYFYSKAIGAVGYGVGKIEVTSPQTIKESVTTPIAQMRHTIDATLLNALPQPEAGIAIALMTGGRAAIDKDTDEAMRISGITHILSISGLHMSIICGLLYAAMRYGLACIPYLALHAPIQKIAALVGLVSGAFYLALADFPLPAIRAYAMIALMFIAILCNREADALRSLILAALGMMLIQPLTVLDVGFQLSFAATWALIVAYRRARILQNNAQAKGWKWHRRAVLFFANIAFSSLVASSATAPFMLYHFGFLSSYSILTNMLTLPILTLTVMPSLILGLVTTAFSDITTPFIVAEYGLMWIVSASHWVASLPESRLSLPQLSGLAMITMSAGIVMLLLARRAWVASMAVLVMGVSGWSGARHTTPPFIFMAEDGSAIAVQVMPEHYLLLRGGEGNFFVKQWQQATNATFISYANARKANTLYGFMCDKAGCAGKVAGMPLRARFDYRDPAPLCLADTSISLATFYAKRLLCPSAQIRIERDALERSGSHTVVMQGESLSVWHPCQGVQHPWLRCK